MPYVNIRVAGTLSKEQKEKISEGVTNVINEVAKKPKNTILLFGLVLVSRRLLDVAAPIFFTV